MTRGGHQLVQDAIGLHADPVFLLKWFEVDIGGLVADTHQEDHVDELAHRGAVGHFQGAFQIDAVFAAGAGAIPASSLQFLDQVNDTFFFGGVESLGLGFHHGLGCCQQHYHLVEGKQVAEVVGG